MNHARILEWGTNLQSCSVKVIQLGKLRYSSTCAHWIKKEEELAHSSANIE